MASRAPGRRPPLDPVYTPIDGTSYTYLSMIMVQHGILSSLPCVILSEAKNLPSLKANRAKNLSQGAGA